MFTLTGTLKDHAGKPVADSAVVITPSPMMTKDSAGNIVYLGGTTVYTNASGVFTASLVANPDALVYTVRSAYGGPMSQPVHFNSPADGTSVNIADVLPVQAPDEYDSYVAGASAYEVALRNGFVGTESQWLASLEGDPGPVGPPGPTGPAGADGADGADGASAYQVAVANGFTGTEQEWVDGQVRTTTASGVTLDYGPSLPPAGQAGRFFIVVP